MAGRAASEHLIRESSVEIIDEPQLNTPRKQTVLRMKALGYLPDVRHPPFTTFWHRRIVLCERHAVRDRKQEQQQESHMLLASGQAHNYQSMQRVGPGPGF
jgi:hypothetical protein